MQNRYVGDIGDFGKYGLLRELFGRGEVPGSGCGLRLGVAWYLNPDEPDKSDGGFIDYPNLKDCDPSLYTVLMQLVEDNRNVAAVQKSGILPTDTLYHNQHLCYPHYERGSFREARRKNWLVGVLENPKKADVVFVDPDNGIATLGMEKNGPLRKKSPKHVFMADLRRFFQLDRSQSLIIYHHLGRTDAVDQIKCLSGRLRQELDLPRRQPWALWYHRGTARVYFIIAQKQHEPILWDRLKDFRDNKCWFQRQPGFLHPHFELVE